MQLACGTIFGPTAAVIAHWFKKRRGFAMGLVAVGSSVGGTVFPIAARNLIPLVGYVVWCSGLCSAMLTPSCRFPWTMRILGFILLFSLGLANLVRRVVTFVFHAFSVIVLP